MDKHIRRKLYKLVLVNAFKDPFIRDDAFFKLLNKMLCLKVISKGNNVRC